MPHYVCPTCKGVSNEKGQCKTEGCASNGKDLKECNCQDGQHGQAES